MSASVTQQFSATMTAAQAASITTGSLTTTTGHAIMLAIITNGGSVTSVTDGAGNSYARLFSGGGGPVLEVWGTTAHSPNGLSSQTITVNFSASNITSCLTGWELAGALNEDLLDVYVAAGSSGTSHNSSATPTIDNTNDLAFGVIGKFPGLSACTFSSLTFTQGTPSTTWGPFNSTLPNGQFVEMISGDLVITSTTGQAFSGTASVTGNAVISCWIIKSATDNQQHFYYTGAAQTWVVPTGMNTVTVDMAGGQGGAGFQAGGKGGRLQATYSTAPGSTWNIYVGGGGSAGGSGGFNGGAAGGSGNTTACFSYNNGGGGGGASDIRVGGTALANRIAVAAGGGGAGGGNTGIQVGGGGGGTSGANGGSGQSSGGAGGTQSSGGGGGGAGAGNGSSGTGGVGGGFTGADGGGGGGGGYFGGGGGGQDAGGGGGSNFAGSGTNVTNTQGYQTSNGYVTLTWSFVAPPPNLGSTLSSLGVG